MLPILQAGYAAILVFVVYATAYEMRVRVHSSDSGSA